MSEQRDFSPSPVKFTVLPSSLLRSYAETGKSRAPKSCGPAKSQFCILTSEICIRLTDASPLQLSLDEGRSGGFGAGELADGALGGLEFHCRVVGDI